MWYIFTGISKIQNQLYTRAKDARYHGANNMMANGDGMLNIHEPITKFVNETATNSGMFQTLIVMNAQLQQQLQAMNQYNNIL